MNHVKYIAVNRVFMHSYKHIRVIGEYKYGRNNIKQQ